ncbi:hypothetical protein CBR_g51385 [Chara braunii]|uniref:Uncharacterized protein n=1 Tax=Chara braunii TaxID=69332 RepID=A0A388M8T8_CHABU|nr:hypothetical protein CBR_g51385 [Chara braunii]|eukprot:GBG90879.1 hypothetical protein CBR_g51385 [Chara braunii]
MDIGTVEAVGELRVVVGAMPLEVCLRSASSYHQPVHSSCGFADIGTLEAVGELRAVVGAMSPEVCLLSTKQFRIAGFAEAGRSEEDG